MEKQIIIKEKVLEQLQVEYIYLVENSSISVAEKFRLGFFSKIKEILPFYNRYPICSFRIPRNKFYRQIVWKNFLIVFKIADDSIIILSLFHTKQNPKRISKI